MLTTTTARCRCCLVIPAATVAASSCCMPNQGTQSPAPPPHTHKLLRHTHIHMYTPATHPCHPLAPCPTFPGRAPRVPQDELPVVAHAAKDVLVVHVPRHILHTQGHQHTSGVTGRDKSHMQLAPWGVHVGAACCSHGSPHQLYTGTCHSVTTPCSVARMIAEHRYMCMLGTP